MNDVAYWAARAKKAERSLAAVEETMVRMELLLEGAQDLTKASPDYWEGGTDAQEYVIARIRGAINRD